ncbi:MAG TPA: hypothetical protein VGM09_27550, partial [Bradyrhizobium sp.]
ISSALPCFRSGPNVTTLSKVVCDVAWGAAMVTDLKTKVEKYESKAAHCKESAQQAIAGPQRAIYEVLAGYYSGLAMDFRQVIEKRNASSVGPADPQAMPAMLGRDAAPDVASWQDGTAEQQQLPDGAPEIVAQGAGEEDGSAAT